MSPSSNTDGLSFFSSLGAAGIAAAINFPLWRASAIAHSGFTPPALPAQSMTFLPSSMRNSASLYKHAMTGPFPGLPAVVGGMTWARCTIFFGSDLLRSLVKETGTENAFMVNVLPAFTVSSFVQVVNMPIIRATITQQDPSFKTSTGNNMTTVQALKHIYSNNGIAGLWHGTSAGLLKTVPKYVVSIVVKDYIGELQKSRNEERGGQIGKGEMAMQSAQKSLAAGICGAVLTNPADVIRNEMFKDDALSLPQTLRNLNKGGWKWMLRGVDKNLIAVAAPVATTIFLTDLFKDVFGNEIRESGEVARRATRKLTRRFTNAEGKK
ncbi:hypothetical protein TrVE_jg12425 [Triparma verrucosa]|nr:hypothetical protein TrST_g5787 [Triparma strigata]GMI05194.1 hypothetical protein TrVE_jg12425 [Triparma verrucosa]